MGQQPLERLVWAEQNTMTESSLFRAQPDAVAPPTGKSESFQLLLAVKNKTERPPHGGQYYSKLQTIKGLSVQKQRYFNTARRIIWVFFLPMSVCSVVSKLSETGFLNPVKSWSGVHVTWHRPKHTCSTYMIEVRVERTRVTITFYQFFPVFTRGQSGVTSRQTECDVTAPITVNYRKVRVVNQTVNICRTHGK